MPLDGDAGYLLYNIRVVFNHPGAKVAFFLDVGKVFFSVFFSGGPVVPDFPGKPGEPGNPEAEAGRDWIA